MDDHFFFGYGSLVNRATHSYPRCAAARVTGWARTWQGTTLRNVAYLTARRESGAAILGMVAAVPGGDWAALDERERAYQRHPVVFDDLAQGNRTGEAQIYAVDPAHTDIGAHPILLSYLDTVVQGYLQVFGDDEARNFFDTTQGWHLPVLEDRDAPIYPRATALSPAERGFVDSNLARMRGL